MPCTFSHPLAVIALHRFTANRLHLAALVVGSMAPDFGYYVGQFPLATFAHSFSGTMAFCLPASLLVLALFYFLRVPMCFLLPQPHRSALLSLACVRPRFDLREGMKVIVSILLGAWSHTIWDSFTHDGAWATQQIAFLREPLRFGDTTLVTSYVFQQLSTFGAGGALLIMYVFWLRKQIRMNYDQNNALGQPRFLFRDSLWVTSDRWRYFLLAGLVIISFVVAISFAIRLAAYYKGYTAVRVLIFRTGIYSAATFIPLFTIAAWIINRGFKPNQTRPGGGNCGR